MAPTARTLSLPIIVIAGIAGTLVYTLFPSGGGENMALKTSTLSLPLIVVAGIAATATLVYTLFSSGGGGGYSDADSVEKSELLKQISTLTSRNQELEASVSTLSEKYSKLKSRLANEKKRETERRTLNRSKLADMSKKLKLEFGNGSETPDENISS